MAGDVDSGVNSANNGHHKAIEWDRARFRDQPVGSGGDGGHELRCDPVLLG